LLTTRNQSTPKAQRACQPEEPKATRNIIYTYIYIYIYVCTQFERTAEVVCLFLFEFLPHVANAASYFTGTMSGYVSKVNIYTCVSVLFHTLLADHYISLDSIAAPSPTWLPMPDDWTRFTMTNCSQEVTYQTLLYFTIKGPTKYVRNHY